MDLKDDIWFCLNETMLYLTDLICHLESEGADSNRASIIEALKAKQHVMTIIGKEREKHSLSLDW